MTQTKADSPDGNEQPVIHPTAILDGDIELSSGVEIGPYCILRGPVSLGPGTRLLSHVQIQGPVTMGRDNTVYPFSCLGFAGQSLDADHDHLGPGVEIGDDNVFRESVTVHRAVTDERPTRIGSGNYLMVNAHVGHDVQFGDDCVLANSVFLGGHAEVHDQVFIGGGAGVHQFCRVGRGAMQGGMTALTRDLPPFFTLTKTNTVGSINKVGMSRRGLPAEQIDDVDWSFHKLYRDGLSFEDARQALEERADRVMVAELIEFIDGSRRGIPRSRARPRPEASTE